MIRGHDKTKRNGSPRLMTTAMVKQHEEERIAAWSGSGKPTDCTPTITAIVAENLKRGMPRIQASICAGIHKATFFNWMLKGRRLGEEPYKTFYESVIAAEAYNMQKSIEEFHQDAKGSWQARAWWLEHRYPNEFGRYVRDATDQIPQNGGDGATYDLSKFSERQLEEFLVQSRELLAQFRSTVVEGESKEVEDGNQ